MHSALPSLLFVRQAYAGVLVLALCLLLSLLVPGEGSSIAFVGCYAAANRSRQFSHARGPTRKQTNRNMYTSSTYLLFTSLIEPSSLYHTPSADPTAMCESYMQENSTSLPRHVAFGILYNNPTVVVLKGGPSHAYLYPVHLSLQACLLRTNLHVLVSARSFSRCRPNPSTLVQALVRVLCHA